MLKPSVYLTRIRQVIEPHAEAGASIPAEVVPSICGFLKLLALECERMEFRLAGEELEDTADATSKIVSLSAWAARKGVAHDEH